MRVLVTGAAGFIGSHLCQRLIADGHEVVGLDDLSVGSLENIADLPEIRFSDTDLLDAESVRIAAAGCDATLHHAARKSVPRSIRQPEAFVDVNVEERRTSCWLPATNAPSSFPHLSSSVYGDQETFPLHEELVPRPRSPSAATKVAGEALIRSWWHSSRALHVVRYFNVYRPGQDPASEYAAVIPRFVTACLSGETPAVYGDGEQARESYPGHHTERTAKEAHLLRDLGRLETSVAISAPESLVSEGIATNALEEALGPEPFDVVAEVLAEMDLRFDPIEANEIHRAALALYASAVNAAFMLHEDGAATEDAEGYLREWALESNERAARTVAFLTDPSSRAYVSAYPDGRRFCRDFAERAPGNFTRLLTEQLTTADLLPG